MIGGTEIEKLAAQKPQLGSPAFQFYPGDYLSSSKVMRMSLEEEGAYIRLLCICWLDGFLPKNEKELAKFCKISALKFCRLWTHIADCFVESEPGKLVNLRLEKERAKQAKFRESKSYAGKKGAQSRWCKPTAPLEIPED